MFIILMILIETFSKLHRNAPGIQLVSESEFKEILELIIIDTQTDINNTLSTHTYILGNTYLYYKIYIYTLYTCIHTYKAQK